MLSQNDCVTVAIVTAIVFLAGIGGYMYMQKCEMEKLSKQDDIKPQDDKLSESARLAKEKKDKISTGNIELDSCLNKIRRFSVFSPRTIPEIQKHVKIIHQTLNKIKLASEEEELDYLKEMKKAESSHQSMLNEFSKLEIELPDDDGAKNIFNTNSNKIKRIAKKYVDDIKLEVENK